MEKSAMKGTDSTRISSFAKAIKDFPAQDPPKRAD
jgi:hypothetical protein